MKIVHITTVPQTLHFLRGQCAYMRRQGAEVTCISSPGPELEGFASDENVRTLAVPMIRGVSPFRDLASLSRLFRLIRMLRPDTVHAHTPKAGLLGMIAARLSNTPVRIYHIHGLRYLTTTGLQRRLLRSVERWSSALATEVLVVSPSVLDLARSEKLIPAGKGRILGGGTVNGVNTSKFEPHLVKQAGLNIRDDLGIPPSAPVLGYVGRITVDKGIGDLSIAWANLKDRFPLAHLVVVGEPEDPVPERALRTLADDPRVHFTGHQDDVRPYMGAFTVMILPSYREGFPQTLLEASACEIPTVGYDIPGVRDAVVNSKTGLLARALDPLSLADSVAHLFDSPVLRNEMGRTARQRVIHEFSPETLWKLTWDLDKALSQDTLNISTVSH